MDAKTIANDHLFRPTPLKKFLQTIIDEEIDSKYSISNVTLEYYSMIVQHFIIPRIAFAHWTIENDNSS